MELDNLRKLVWKLYKDWKSYLIIPLDPSGPRSGLNIILAKYEIQCVQSASGSPSSKTFG